MTYDPSTDPGNRDPWADPRRLREVFPWRVELDPDGSWTLYDRENHQWGSFGDDWDAAEAKRLELGRKAYQIPDPATRRTSPSPGPTTMRGRQT